MISKLEHSLGYEENLCCIVIKQLDDIRHFSGTNHTLISKQPNHIKVYQALPIGPYNMYKLELKDS